MKGLSVLDIVFSVLRLSVLFLAVGFTIYFLLHSMSAVFFPFDLDYGEGMQLHMSYMLGKGSSLYRNLSSYPYLAYVHPPVYPLLSASLISVTGKSFLAGRLISFTASLLTGLLIFLVVCKETGNRLAGILSALFFFSSPYVMSWSPLFRVDMLAVFLSLLGTYIFVLYGKSNKAYLSIPVFLLAVYSKQSAFVAPLAVCLCLLYKDPKKSLRYALVFGISFVAIFIALDHVTGGEFYRNLVLYNELSYSIPHALQLIYAFILLHAVLLFFAAAHLKKSAATVWPIYFFVSIASSFAMLGRTGSTINYFLEPIALLSVFAGFFLHRSGLLRLTGGTCLKTVLFAVLAVVQFSLFALAISEPQLFFLVPTQNESAESRMYGILRGADGPVLSEVAGFSVLKDDDALIDSYMMYELEKKGLWNHSRLVRDCYAKKFSLIVLVYYNRLDEFRDLMECVDRNYRQIDRIKYFESGYPFYVYERAG